VNFVLIFLPQGTQGFSQETLRNSKRPFFRLIAKFFFVLTCFGGKIKNTLNPISQAQNPLSSSNMAISSCLPWEMDKDELSLELQ
jgi:hypothetical protein